ncbi:MAG: tRNA 4-thiouridine(8) synthase ThiI [Candidatus Bathyarchaeota archaeon]|nr:tRNA 4-thiouridine(8) synthase ThiI [Candidatus Bathyarchaeota archaeon]MDW8040997.1 tRNA 4-thiouridine(8) synthase ThiI [Nitrososphaerota archaeon]
MEKPKVKALALFSGGLDSSLAIKLIQEQGIDVEAVTFLTPFYSARAGGFSLERAAQQLGVRLTVMRLGLDYLRIIRKPKHGYGRHMNPCIDCRIYMLKKAKQYARRIGAAFVITGEVLDERPMSQHWKALKIVEEESSLKGRLLRPLSAKLLPPTEPEKAGIVDRSRLLDIRGRSRRRQLALAKAYGVTEYQSPSGGCLLTSKEFAAKLRDLLDHKKRVSTADLELLKIGRHFRFGKNKIIVGRNKEENETLLKLKGRNDYFFEAVGTGSPVTLLHGPKTRQAIEKAAQLTAYYSDQKTGEVQVQYGRTKPEKTITVERPNPQQIERLRIK